MTERPLPSTRPLAEKLRYSPQQRAAVLNAPTGYVQHFAGEVSQELDGTVDFLQVFATRRHELLRDGPTWRSALAPGGILWVCYPKGQSLETDLNRDVVRVTLAEVGLEVVSQVAVDEVWSAMRAKRQDA
jgi:hypothetical protein